MRPFVCRSENFHNRTDLEKTASSSSIVGISQAVTMGVTCLREEDVLTQSGQG